MPRAPGSTASRATLAGGKLSGDLMIKRDLDGTAGISGTLRLDGAAAEEFAWQRDDRPMVTGAFSIDAQVNATGRTLAGWMSSLTGGGSFSLQNGRLAHMTTRAFDQVIRLADAGKDLSEDRIRQAFTDNVDMGDLSVDRLDAAYTLAGGTFRAPNIVVTGKDGGTSGSATADLARLSVDSEWRLSLDGGDAAVGGGVPQVSVLFKGPIDDPSRRIDVTAFASYLGIRALEKETQRVLTMQADIQERELLSRQVLRDRETLDRRNRLMLEARERTAAAALAEKAKAAALLAAQKARAEKPASADPLDAIGKILENGSPAQPGAKLKQLPSSDVGLPPGGVSGSAP